jgi:ribosomal-protein-alanine N-acetyltransferase
MNMFDPLLTDRMVAYPLDDGDLEELRDSHQNPEVMEFVGGTRTREETRRWLDENLDHWKSHGFGLWIFRSNTDRSFVGRCGLRHAQVDDAIEVQLGYYLAPRYWGMGMATEMAIAVLTTGFKKLALSSVIVLVDPANTRSRRVAERLGSHFERNTIWKSSPAVIYRIEGHEWIERHRARLDMAG